MVVIDVDVDILEVVVWSLFRWCFSDEIWFEFVWVVLLSASDGVDEDDLRFRSGSDLWLRDRSETA